MQVAAIRDLLLRTPTGNVPVPVRVFVPEHTGADWKCRCEIDWPGEPEQRVTYGSDAMQALVLALQGIGTMIYTSDQHESGNLSWPRSGGGYGFPVLPIVRDRLTGDDLRFV
jgi:hypothetical protein